MWRASCQPEASVIVTSVGMISNILGMKRAENSTRDYTGWPSASNAYMDPGPNIPEVLYTITQLKPVS